MRSWSSALLLAAVVAFPAPAAAADPPGAGVQPAPTPSAAQPVAAPSAAQPVAAPSAAQSVAVPSAALPVAAPSAAQPASAARPASAASAVAAVLAQPAAGANHHRHQRPALVAIRPVDPGVAAGTSVLVARYDFDGRRLTGKITDESGRGHTLRTVTAHGGSVRLVVHGKGSAIAFPAECAAGTCPHVALRSPSSADLNPGTRNIAFGADVLLPPGQTSKGENIVQKGYSMTSSQWKLQVDGMAGRPSCVLVDDKRPRIRIAYSSVSIADGRWHSLQCRRAGTTLAIFVDGVTRGSIAVPGTLSVTNRHPLSIGAKGAFADNDQFNGALDNVWVQIG
jgi:hypothetical protein